MDNTQQQTDLQAAPAEPTTDEMWAAIIRYHDKAECDQVISSMEEGATIWGVYRVRLRSDAFVGIGLSREAAIRDAYSRLPKPAAVQQESAGLTVEGEITCGNVFLNHVTQTRNICARKIGHDDFCVGPEFDAPASAEPQSDRGAAPAESLCKHRWVSEPDSATHCDLCGTFLDGYSGKVSAPHGGTPALISAERLGVMLRRSMQVLDDYDRITDPSLIDALRDVREWHETIVGLCKEVIASRSKQAENQALRERVLEEVADALNSPAFIESLLDASSFIRALKPQADGSVKP